MSQASRSKNILIKSARITLKTVLIILVVIICLVLLVQAPFVQNFARGKAESWLEGKIHTKVRVGHLYIGFPKTIEIRDVYFEDQQKDTLFSAGTPRHRHQSVQIIESPGGSE